MHAWLLALWLCNEPSADWQLVERVVAVIDDRIVLASELDRRVDVARAALARITDRTERDRRLTGLRAEVLQTIVDEQLIDQAAARIGLTVDPSQIDAAITEIRAHFALDEAGLAQAVAEQGWTMAEYRRDLHHHLLRYKLLSAVLTPDKYPLSDDAVKAEYAAEKARNPALGDLAGESERLRSVLFERALDAWLTEARRTAHVELRP